MVNQVQIPNIIDGSTIIWLSKSVVK